MLELLTAAEMARADQLAAEAGVSGAILMDHAGRAVAETLQSRFPDGRRVSVLCGPGNNGGDGFVAAHYLRDLGYAVRVGLLGEVAKLTGDAAGAAAKWRCPVEPLGLPLLDEADVIVDAVFGAGLSRPIEGAAAALIERANESGVPIVAIDVPSGVDGSSGEILSVAIQALITVTFFRKKPGHLLLPGQLHCGEVVLADIGIPDTVLDTIKPNAFADESDLWLSHFPWPQPGGHKYLRGHAVVVSGPEDATGAARLAARGALRVGAGLVTVASPAKALPVNAAQLTAIMVREVEGGDDLARLLSDKRKNVVVLGPGLGIGEHSRSLALAALASQAAVVLDADGLTSFADDPDQLFQAVERRTAPVVFTPHEGEFARLFGPASGKPGEGPSKLERARQAAHRSGAMLVLKGSDTVIAMPDGRAAINATSSPWLATAGTGDVLAGIVGGMLAQSMAAAQSMSVETITHFETVAAAVWLHGAAGRTFGPGLIAEDVPEMLPRLFRRLLEASGQTGFQRPDTTW